MHKNIYLVLLLGLAMLLGACDSDAEKTTAETDTGTNTAIDSDSGSGSAAPTTDDLVGTYAEKVVLASIDDMPGIGKLASTGTYYGLTDITLKDGVLMATSRYCRSVVGGSTMVTVEFPDELTQLIPPLGAPLEVTEENGTLKIVRQEAVSPVAVTLEDPWNDPLPTDPADPRIIDLDQDGKPGLTIKLTAMGIKGEMYCVRRERNSWQGTLGADRRIVGLQHDISEQSIVDADPKMFAINMTSIPDPDASKSTIELRPLPAPLDCAALLSQIDTLFP